jgi:hypothetical protein
MKPSWVPNCETIKYSAGLAEIYVNRVTHNRSKVGNGVHQATVQPPISQHAVIVWHSNSELILAIVEKEQPFTRPRHQKNELGSILFTSDTRMRCHRDLVRFKKLENIGG